MGKLIINSKTYGEKIVLYDDEDVLLINKYKWRIYKGKPDNQWYAIAHTPMINNKRKIIRMHNLVTNQLFIDHKNGNGLDNRKENLRKANHSKNSMNRRTTRKNKKCKYKGLIKHNNKYVAKIIINKKQIYLGVFANQEDAAIAYNKAAIKYFGEFAFLNVIERKV